MDDRGLLLLRDPSHPAARVYWAPSTYQALACGPSESIYDEVAVIVSSPFDR